MNIDDSNRNRRGLYASDTEPRRLPISPTSPLKYGRPKTRGSVESSPLEGPSSPMSYIDSWNHPGTRIDYAIPRPPTPPRSSARVPSGSLYRTSSGKSAQSISNVSNTSSYSLYPAPTRPLPPIPPPKSSSSQRHSGSTDSHSRASISTTRSTPSMAGSAPQFEILHQIPTQRYSTGSRAVSHKSATPLVLNFWKNIVVNTKRANNSVHFLDISPSGATLSSKHGNNLVNVWGIDSGNLLSTIKFSSYTEARSRSRDYMIRSHAIISESATLIAIATRFGRSIDIYDWVKKKSIQCIADADRWATTKNEIFDSSLDGRASLAVYRGEEHSVELYLANREKKKPFMSLREINLKEAGLPFVPLYPELAFSSTSPLLVLAAGPRPPTAGHPPPEKETLLAAWETQIDSMSPLKPYRVVRPWQHKELDTAVPFDLVTYGSVTVSIWIPASFRTVPGRGGSGYNIVPVAVPNRHVLFWDMAANATRTFPIPNCTSCVSPDCRFVAYCNTSGAEIGARGTIAIVDVVTSEEVWSWPDKDAIAGPQHNPIHFEDLSTINELSFSADSRFLIVGGSNGIMGIYDVRELAPERF